VRREVGYWLLVVGVMVGFLALAVLIVVLPTWGVPSSVSLGIGVALLVAYVITVWRSFLKSPT